MKFVAYFACCIDQNTLKRFMVTWARFMVHTYFTKYVHPPDTAEEIAEVLHLQSKLGFPGCIGMCDGVEFMIENCPDSELNSHTGGKGSVHIHGDSTSPGMLAGRSMPSPAPSIQQPMTARAVASRTQKTAATRWAVAHGEKAVAISSVGVFTVNQKSLLL